MKKASSVLLLIGAILSFVGILFYIIFGSVMFGLASPANTQMIIDGINNGSITVSGVSGTPEQIAAYLQQVASGLGVFFLITGLFSIVPGILALIARKKQTTGLYVATLVLSILAGFNIITLLGSIFGLADHDR